MANLAEGACSQGWMGREKDWFEGWLSDVLMRVTRAERVLVASERDSDERAALRQRLDGAAAVDVDELHASLVPGCATSSGCCSAAKDCSIR